ncbi:glycosyltransferase family 2 protein [Ulvibacterium sp.]|uniref:glycosyltransferase family 2 protein n=1 Tax=Ulvibacterium sp. TaxID=2665914 RepID=UPI003CC643E4
MKTKVLLSIVSPVYRAEDIVDELVKQIILNVKDIDGDFEIVLVDDGSPDQSWNRIAENCKKNKRVKGVKLSRNFGQHYAITAGLSVATGEWIIVMDCDLQDNPKEINNLFNEAQKGHDLVLARRKLRNDSFIKRTMSKWFYALFGYLTDTKQDAAIANYGIYNRKVVDAILSMKDKVRYFPTMTQWVGFSAHYIDVNHNQRISGKSSYNWKSLFRLGFNNIIAFSSKPLLLTIRLGVIISTLSFLLGGYYFVMYLKGKIDEPGFPSVIISIWFLGGVIISILGVIGLYIGKTFNQTKDRPNYIIDKVANL